MMRCVEITCVLREDCLQRQMGRTLLMILSVHDVHILCVHSHGSIQWLCSPCWKLRNHQGNLWSLGFVAIFIHTANVSCWNVCMCVCVRFDIWYWTFCLSWMNKQSYYVRRSICYLAEPAVHLRKIFLVSHRCSCALIQKTWFWNLSA